ncbi:MULTISPECIES: hypothetical protein [Pseudoalteromonas]|uniref:hypothetical protein n=1 Tax=Pseudoalteromonas TaxID=53246 RepID=UPI00102272FD|nr:hypothetical protein [Pseudoalteromonas sp. MEBiC 03485]RZD19729.1 hypothetical protein EVU92_21235 [Pseudoalteromonas sp. MEBiC 03485]
MRLFNTPETHFSTHVHNYTNVNTFISNQVLDDSLRHETLKLINLVKLGTKSQYVYSGNVDFKKLFGTEYTNVMFDSLMHVLPDELEPFGVMFLDACNQPVHYAVRVSINREFYYLDAYGLNSDISVIKGRFGRCTITSIKHFCANNKYDPYYSGYQTLLNETNSVFMLKSEQARHEFYMQIAYTLINLIVYGSGTH